MWRKCDGIENVFINTLLCILKKKKPKKSFWLYGHFKANKEALFAYQLVVFFQNKNTKTQFVKLHGPWQTLADCAEKRLIKMPIKEYDIDFTTWYDKYLSDGLRDKLAKYNPFKIHDSSIAKPKCYYVAYFKKEYLNEFIGHEDKFTFFPQPERSRMVEYICDQTRFGEGK